MAPEPLSTVADATALGLSTPQNTDLISSGDDAISLNARHLADVLKRTELRDWSQSLNLLTTVGGYRWTGVNPPTTAEGWPATWDPNDNAALRRIDVMRRGTGGLDLIQEIRTTARTFRRLIGGTSYQGPWHVWYADGAKPAPPLTTAHAGHLDTLPTTPGWYTYTGTAATTAEGFPADFTENAGTRLLEVTPRGGGSANTYQRIWGFSGIWVRWRSGSTFGAWQKWAPGTGGTGGTGDTTTAQTVTLWDRFDAHKDATATAQGYTGALGSAATGQPWGVRSGDMAGAAPRITGGQLTSDKTAYFEAPVGAPITRMGATFVLDNLGGTATNQGSLAIICWGDGGAVNNIGTGWGRTACHFVITRQFVWLDYQDEKPGTATTAVKSIVSGQALATQLVEDGITEHSVDIRIDRAAHTITVSISTGEVLTFTHEGIKDMGPAEGTHLCLEPYYNAASGVVESRPRVVRCWAESALNPARHGLPAN